MNQPMMITFATVYPANLRTRAILSQMTFREATKTQLFFFGPFTRSVLPEFHPFDVLLTSGSNYSTWIVESSLLIANTAYCSVVIRSIACVLLASQSCAPNFTKIFQFLAHRSLETEICFGDPLIGTEAVFDYRQTFVSKYFLPPHSPLLYV